MSTNLIAHLKKKCEEDDNVKILLSQWEFDQKLVGKALENIGGFYPHFSNHNASHSQQILVNIERLLGDDIDLLSATDTWLILEAAYWHDAGMLVDAEKAKKVHDEENFKKMLHEIVQNKSSELYEFAKVFLNDNWQGAIALEKHPFDGVEKYRQLIAEYFRKEHANRIGNIVLEDYKNLGINTPRTELLPTRLFRYLGSICVGHGMNFEKMMEVLPRCQTGLGTEDCHPLFVACLLRLGDLFDLDDNRFCPVMAKHVSNMPSVSQHHHDKHLSLREFQLDKRTVKLVAECPDEMSYVETQNWFGWIREEFQNQMSQWNLIVPDLKFGSLPTIEQLEVRMKIEYSKDIRKEKILLKNKPMKFTIDEKNGIEILQGSNLYANKNSIYRELIQNAIDSTMIRVWFEHKDELRRLNPYHKRYLEIIEDYQISVDLKKLKDIDGTLDAIWKFTIKDKGIGISKNDLVHMQNMAGSYKNLEKIKMVEEMPIWMRPSGKFGIGLQSAFLLLDRDLDEQDKKIQFKTCSYINNEVLEIEMFSPLGGKQGYCFITKIDGELYREYGAELSVVIKSNFDFSRWGFLNSESAGKYWDRDVFDIKWREKELNNITKNIIVNSPICSEKNIENIRWDGKNCIAYKFELNNFRQFLGFRGQNTRIDRYDSKIRKLLCGVHIDFYSLDPSEVLNISRDRWKENFLKKIEDEIFEYMGKYISENDTNETSMLLKIYAHEFKNLKLENNKFRDFKFEFTSDEGTENDKCLNELEEIEEFYVFFTPRYLPFKFRVNFEDLCGNIKYFITSHEKVLEIFKILKHKYPGEVFNSHKMYSMNKDGYIGVSCIFVSKFNNNGFDKIIDEDIKWLEIKDEVVKDEIKSIRDVFRFIRQAIDSLGESSLRSYYDLFDFEKIKVPEILNEYEDLVIKELDDERVIINPYQVINNQIQLTNLSDLSILVAQYKGREKINYEKILSSYESLKEKIEEECKEYLN
ncbi:HD domain-containing protein [Acinetobacter sp. 1125_18A]|uniref:HD domain-containing protein n=1 Tax=Acinetobacter sp. 1125_18A TaxID=2605959 RepID=UPI004059FFBE